MNICIKLSNKKINIEFINDIKLLNKKFTIEFVKHLY